MTNTPKFPWETALRTDRYDFFWGGPFSQWYPSVFMINGIQYGCAEQYMMCGKARLFGDEEALAEIMASDDPKTQKRIGRRVKGFDVAQWEAVARDVVREANLAKFSQNPRLYQYIMDSGDRTIVEASPEDRVWGIGRGAWEPNNEDESTWNGTNWLGEVLMQVREQLRES